MTSSPFSTSFTITIAAVLVATAASRCGGTSPASPSSGSALSGVTLGATSVAAGGTIGGTVTLGAPAPAGGATVVLTSSNPAVATVQSPVTVAADQTTATIVVSTVSPGTAIIAGSYNGTTRQTPPLTVTARPQLVLSSLSVVPSTLVGGEAARGTVVLNDNAPAGGAVVSLSSRDPVAVPDSVTVPAGFASATFTVMTKAVTSATSVGIQGSYAGSSATAALDVTPPLVATARFGVTGPTETDTCVLTGGGTMLNCTFNGSTSTAPGRITAWDWTYGVLKTVAQTTSGPVLSMPAVDCQMLPPPPLPAGSPQWLTMEVTLVVHDDRGNVSAKAVNSSVRVIPAGACGF